MLYRVPGQVVTARVTCRYSYQGLHATRPVWIVPARCPRYIGGRVHTPEESHKVALPPVPRRHPVELKAAFLEGAVPEDSENVEDVYFHWRSLGQAVDCEVDREPGGRQVAGQRLRTGSSTSDLGGAAGSIRNCSTKLQVTCLPLASILVARSSRSSCLMSAACSRSSNDSPSQIREASR